LNPACEQSQIRPTLGVQGRGQRRATLWRNGKRAPPVVAHRRTIQPEPSSHFAEAQIHARLTNPAKPNIITSIRGSRRPVADFKSEPRPASNRNPGRLPIGMRGRLRRYPHMSSLVGYLAKFASPEAHFAFGRSFRRARGSHRLEGGGDRVRLSRALERDLLDAGVIRPFCRTYAKRREARVR
jgi:hypothetical protein